MIDPSRISRRVARRIQRRRERRERRRQRRAGRNPFVGPLFAGMALICAGVWFTIDTFFVRLPGIDRLWPFAMILFGFATLASFVLGGLRDPRRVFPGMASLLIGAFFLLITLGPLDWDQMGALWPVFPLLAGVSFFWTWLAHFGRDNGLLVPAALGIGTGVIGLFFTLTPLGPSMVAFAWPLILIGVGTIMVAGVVLRFVARSAGFARRAL